MLQREKGSLIIFGCGYLGERLAHRMLERGCAVTAVTRNAEQAARVRGLGAQVWVGAIESGEWRGSVPASFDYSVLCAGAGREGLEGYRRSYPEAMAAIIEWALNASVRQQVFTSSTSVYAQNSGEVVSEEGPAEGSTPGARILLEAERLLSTSNCFERWFTFRLGGLYGPGRTHLLERVAREGLLQESGGEDDGVLNLIRVEDAVAAIEAALSGASATPGLFNIVDDAPTPRREVTAWIRGELERRGLLGKGEALAEPRVRGRGRNRFVSNRKARTALDWRPRFPDFRMGYSDLIAAMAQ